MELFFIFCNLATRTIKKILMNKEQINDEADLLAKKERLEKLQKKYSFRTNSERLEPFYKMFIGLSFGLQILSAIFAAGGVLLLSAVFSKSFGVVIIATIALLLLLEAFKRISYDEYNRQRNSKEQISKTILIFCAVGASLSVCSSYLGAPHAIKFFSAEPDLIDIELIKENNSQKLAQNSAYWGKLGAEAERQAKLINENNNRRGVTRSRAVKAEQAQFNLIKNYKDSLVKYAAIIQAGERSEIQAAKNKNKELKSINKDWIVTFGNYSAFASLGFEVVLFLTLFWCSNFEKRELKEAKTLIKEPTKKAKRSIKDVIKEKVKNVSNDTPEASLVTNNIQIKQGKEESKGEPREGDIVPPVGKQKVPRIWVSLDDGERLELCRKSEINNHIRGNDPERAKHFEKYLIKLNNWNNEKQ
jgi:hypothetical protein